jgi:hypothetical protein
VLEAHDQNSAVTVCYLVPELPTGIPLRIGCGRRTFSSRRRLRVQAPLVKDRAPLPGYIDGLSLPSKMPSRIRGAPLWQLRVPGRLRALHRPIGPTSDSRQDDLGRLENLGASCPGYRPKSPNWLGYASRARRCRGSIRRCDIPAVACGR